jgi:hypothetical protein
MLASNNVEGPHPVEKAGDKPSCNELFKTIWDNAAKLDRQTQWQSGLNGEFSEHIPGAIRNSANNALNQSRDSIKTQLETDIDDYLYRCGPFDIPGKRAAYDSMRSLKTGLEQQGANYDVGAWQANFAAEFPDEVPHSDPPPSLPNVGDFARAGAAGAAALVLGALRALGSSFIPDWAH